MSSNKTSTFVHGNSSGCIVFPDTLQNFCLACSIIIGLMAMYLTVSLTQNYIMESRKGRRHGKNRARLSSIHTSQGKKGRFFKQLMTIYSISAAFIVMVRCCIDVVVLQTGFVANPNYVALSRTEIILNIMALSCIYLILWIRLWSFYCHPGLEGERRFVRLKYVCAVLLIVMVATGIYNAYGFLSDRDIYVDEKGCIVRKIVHLKFYILGGCTLFYQIVLLGLFAYPLFLHARNSVLGENNMKKSIIKVLKRVFIVALICCLTDTVTTIISAVSENIYPECSFLLYNLNIASNLFALLYSFSDWKIRMFYPFLYCCHTVPSNWPTSTTVASNNQSSQV